MYRDLITTVFVPQPSIRFAWIWFLHKEMRLATIVVVLLFSPMQILMPGRFNKARTELARKSADATRSGDGGFAPRT